LDGDDLSRFERHLKECADCRAAVRELREASTGLALALPPQTPSPRLRERVMAVARPRRRPWALAAAAAAAVLAAVLFMALRASERTFEIAGENGASGKVAAAGRRIRFEARALPPLAAGKVWQLWHLVPEQQPVTAGLYSPDPNGRVAGAYELAVAAVPGHAFALTMEPAGGSKAPTSKLYLAPAGN
jgi:anti-sigma-K factor RskA